jgi:hypothetical protein
MAKPDKEALPTFTALIVHNRDLKLAEVWPDANDKIPSSV